MKKITPDPPETPSVPPYDPFDPKKLHEAAERALDHHFKPSLDNLRSSDSPTTNLFTVATHIDTESLLANASETLASVNAIAGDLAFELEGSRRSVALGIYQMVELCKLLVDQALEQVDRRGCSGKG
ncbi:DUF6124 family protein [Pseudomonas fluorescens]|uniref:DUF3077 domain-containing protein n=1 Tax=Pseudomonas fluorescens TaxID=294 RepID=A0A5E7DG22_PSEFL|nr:DUF6124 family protein [Pseudomonas fluorescens]VVO16390.1 hypothetical protein PS691_03830 [Pseudomonas fluorescens]